MYLKHSMQHMDGIFFKNSLKASRRRRPAQPWALKALRSQLKQQLNLQRLVHHTYESHPASRHHSIAMKDPLQHSCNHSKSAAQRAGRFVQVMDVFAMNHHSSATTLQELRGLSARGP